jgi:hypothetical protein
MQAPRRIHGGTVRGRRRAVHSPDRPPSTETAMAKSLDKKKEDKKKPEKSLKEKRAAKKEKKAGK